MALRLGVSILFLVSTGLHAQETTLFTQLPADQTGITFKNILDESPTANVLTYEYFYNGGGVAVGDINNDGLDDIYFTANMRSNSLFLNEGNFKFRDITAKAGVSCDTGWKTGVTMADVNGDGLPDIYVCHSGKGDPEKRRNKLFINNGDLTFTERAAEYGLDDPGHSTHASFFDFDRDGDLDMYLLNHNVTVINEFEFASAKKKRDPYAGDKLYRNDNGKFVDVSEAAGIKGNPLGFGLGVTVADVNQDGWPDIYVSNDYVEPDYLYINNGNGTFTDRMTQYMQHISYFSMGCDVSDINNDGWVDIYTLDMLPEDNKRQKLLYGPENYEHYALMVLNGFYFQNMRNMLHLNNRNGTYSEIGQFAGISNTDWSWAPLFVDFDNDGWKDLFVANGYYRDYTNRDFLKFKGDYYFEMAKANQEADTFKLVTTMTSTPLQNYIFKNNGDLTFSDKSAAWGFTDKNFSSGSAYADFDNDGDIDLVVNNQNEFASVYRNETRQRYPDRNFLAILLKSAGGNTEAIGSKVMVYTHGQVQYFEKMHTRGFQSCVTERIHVGLGANTSADSLVVLWPNGARTVQHAVPAGQLLVLEQPEVSGGSGAMSEHTTDPLFSRVDTKIPYTHAEYGFNDFKRQPLLLTMLTNCGPVMTTGDVNGDGLDDVYVGGAQDNPGKLYFQTETGAFIESKQFAQAYDGRRFTDGDARFIDVDNDDDLDLYLVSGGYNNYKEDDPALQDRLFLNDGNGNFTYKPDGLPGATSKSCVAFADFDKDGDQDLFVGGRVIPGSYPVTPESFLLINDGDCSFTRATASVAPRLEKIGMVTDAEWVDINGDGWLDLVVAGEFMAIEVFINRNGKLLEHATNRYFDQPLKGFWSRIVSGDFDGDGDQDLIVGNLGLNTQLRASEKEPVELVYKDFDKNGSVDPILTYYIQGTSYPFASRDELLDQIRSLRSKFTDYASYANARLEDIFSKGDLKNAQRLQINRLETTYLENRDGKLVIRELPPEIQFSPVHAFAIADVDGDGSQDLVVGGNQSAIRIRMGVIDANFGQVFKNDGKGNFSYVGQAASGLATTGDVKSMAMITVGGKPYLLIGINNVGIETYKLHEN
ncbi:MAG TPA: VCBS repeat-containing protein [Cyclobacteriaceae bacterium]